jgi:hypothetical protein
MLRVFEKRASTILFNTLKGNQYQFEGGYIVLPANVCPIVPATFLKAGVKFKFLDIDLYTQCIDISLIYQELKSPFCKGILFVHSYGNTQNTLELFEEIRLLRNDLFLIDDRCVDVPITVDTMQNQFADLILYSTGYAKVVEFGFGGFAFLSEKAGYKKFFGRFSEMHHRNLVTQLNQSIENCKPFHYVDSDWLEFINNFDEKAYFEKIETQIPISITQKNKLNKIYNYHLPEEIQMSSSLCLWRFNLQVPNKKKLIKAIFDSDLFASSHFGSISTLFGGDYAPMAEKAHSNMLNLFNDFRFSEDDALRICDIIRKNLK